MVDGNPHPPSQSERTQERGVAVGIIAADASSDLVAGAILRAQARGYPVLLTYRGPENREAVRFGMTLGADVIDPPTSGQTSDELAETLTAHARGTGHEGVLLHDPSEGRIDYDESHRRLGDGFAVDTTIRADTANAVFVGIPAYNEAETIGEVVRAASEHADVVLVVDDGSQDDTASIASDAGATVISHDRNSGYGATLKHLFQEARARQASHLVILDGDGQHDTDDIPTLLSQQRDLDCDIVIGSRFVDGGGMDGPLHRRLGLSIINFLTNLSLGILHPRSWIADTQSGFRLYNRHAIETLAEIDTIDDKMGASTDLLYHASYHDLVVREVGTHVSYDGEDTSTHHPFAHGAAIVNNIIRTIETERPITALGIPGLVMLCFGAGFSYWAIQNFVRTGTFPLGIGITTVVFTLAGIFTTFTAIILHSLSVHERTT